MAKGIDIVCFYLGSFKVTDNLCFNYVCVCNAAMDIPNLSLHKTAIFLYTIYHN